VSSPWQFASGISGGHLTRRVEAIMNARNIRRLDPLRKTLVTTVALSLLAFPLVVGATTAAPAGSGDDLRLPDAPRPSVLSVPAAMAMPAAPSAPEPSPLAARQAPADQAPAPAPADPPQASDAVAPQAPDAPVRVGGDIKEPTKIVNVTPVYPEAALANRVEGIVIIEATIGTDGTVADAKVLRGHPLLNQAAVDAVSQWVFTPTTLNGQPVAVLMAVTVNFKLQ
jgi:TonB family protein